MMLGDGKQKFVYMMETVAENGYDLNKFNKYYSERFKRKLDVKEIEFDRLKIICNDYKMWQIDPTYDPDAQPEV